MRNIIGYFILSMNSTLGKGGTSEGFVKEVLSQSLSLGARRKGGTSEN